MPITRVHVASLLPCTFVANILPMLYLVPGVKVSHTISQNTHAQRVLSHFGEKIFREDFLQVRHTECLSKIFIKVAVQCNSKPTFPASKTGISEGFKDFFVINSRVRFSLKRVSLPLLSENRTLSPRNTSLGMFHIFFNAVHSDTFHRCISRLSKINTAPQIVIYTGTKVQYSVWSLSLLALSYESG